MEKTTFQLPNEVPSQTTSNGFDQTNMTTSEYKKVATTNSLAKYNHLPNTNLQFNTFEATLVKHATALERLKWLGVILAVSIVINTATFAGLTGSLVSYIIIIVVAVIIIIIIIIIYNIYQKKAYKYYKILILVDFMFYTIT